MSLTVRIIPFKIENKDQYIETYKDSVLFDYMDGYLHLWCDTSKDIAKFEVEKHYERPHGQYHARLVHNSVLYYLTLGEYKSYD